MHTLLVTLTLFAAGAESARIFDARTREEISLASLADRLAQRDVVFLGEDHDNAAGHQVQLAVVKQLHQQRPDLVLSMEMFERDVQGAVDDYLKGRIDEQRFLELSRPWADYKKFYRPILEYARANQLDVIAANVPRKAASAVSQGKEPTASAAAHLPRKSHAPQDAYWERFVEIMGDHAGTEGPKAMQRYYRAQCLKDDAMAESITDYLAQHKHRRPLVVHLCGKFHSDFGHGTAWRVLNRNPLVHIGVVSMEAVGDVPSFKPGEELGRGHYLIAVPQPPQQKSKGEEAASPKDPSTNEVEGSES